MGQCSPGTPPARNDSSWVGSWALTWYPTTAHFHPRVRDLLLADSPATSLSPPAGRTLPRQRPLWVLERMRRHRAAIELYGSSEYESLLGRARGRTSIRRGCG